MEMRTNVPGGIASTEAAMGERHGIGPWRRSWSIFRGRLFTQGTVRFVRQTRERFGLTGACALRLDGLGGYLVSDPGWTGPEVWQHETQPEEDQHHELLVDVVRNHRIAPLADGGRGSFYPVFRPHELSAAVGYTTQHRGSVVKVEMVTPRTKPCMLLYAA
jgi:hypothetical protein